ncbi:MAG: undecaprenyl-diphosphate phosphatase [Clostridiales bacterium]|jgi:undecaprenyl-diphosphatase|nr:undecaprenyl-diphosphate phosphatase [Clostridiales bacterium]
MNVLEAVILGIIQGMAEFLPISSSGHLVLFQNLFGLKENPRLFDVILHVGTLVPIFIVYRRDIGALIKRPLQRMTGILIIGTVPAVAAALFFEERIDALFKGGAPLALAFILTGLFLLYSDNVLEGSKTERKVTILDGLIIGVMQAVAIPPGVSRSGSTITGALACRLDRQTAAKFSFLLSIPVIVGAAVLEGVSIYREGLRFTESDIKIYAFGFAAAALTGYLSIKFMLRLVTNCKLKYFALYVFLLAAFILLDVYFIHTFPWG